MVSQALAQSEVTVRVGEQFAALGVRHQSRLWLQAGVGFALCLFLLVGVAVANAVGRRWSRPRPALVETGDA